MKRSRRCLSVVALTVCALALCGSVASAASSPSVVRTPIKTVRVA